MKRLLMATDLSPRSDRAIERAINIAHQKGATLTILHVIDGDLPKGVVEVQKRIVTETINEQVETLTKSERTHISVQVLLGRPYMEILEMSDKMDAEMIILGTHHEDVLKCMFRGTTVERVIRVGHLPVLVVKDFVRGPYKQVMVGVDFSVFSRRAIEFAVSFVPSALFNLVHAYHVPFKGFLHSKSIEQEVKKQEQLELQSLVDGEMTVFLSSLSAENSILNTVMQEGGVRDVIYEQTQILKPDLLVIGTHGRTGIAHAFLGSVAEDVLNQPPCDVLVVKAYGVLVRRETGERDGRHMCSQRFSSNLNSLSYSQISSSGKSRTETMPKPSSGSFRTTT